MSRGCFAGFDSLQILQGVAHFGIAVAEFPGQRPFGHGHQTAVGGWIQAGDGLGRPRQDLIQDFLRAPSLIRRLAGQHLVEQGAESVNIAPGVFGVAGRHARRHVRRGALQMPVGHVHDRVVEQGARQSEIAKANLAGGAQKDVGRFEVPVNDAAPMRKGQPFGHLRGNVQNRLRRPAAVRV